MEDEKTISVEMDYEANGAGMNPSPKDESAEENQETNNQEEMPQEADNQDEDDEDVPARPTRWSKIKKEREEKYKLAQEIEELRQQNLEMQTLLYQTVDSNSDFYKERANAELDYAEKMLEKALEEGDVKGVSKATAAIAQATNVVKEMSNKQALAKYSLDDVRAIRRDPAKVASQHLLKDWIRDNPELNPESSRFNPELVEKMKPIISTLETRLRNNDQAHMIATPQYFNLLDKLKLTVVKDSYRYNRHVGPVRSKYRSFGSSERSIELTPDQREAAAAFNMTEEKYASWLKKYATEENTKR